METNQKKNALPDDLYLLSEEGFSDPDDPNHPNRLCICISDVHFTDGTVGNQGADEVVWEEVFNNIIDLCLKHDIEELTLVLAGDVADVIRSAQWTECGVYPWKREDPAFKTTLRNIMRKIIEIHATPPMASKKAGFFFLLQQLPKNLEKRSYNDKQIHNIAIRTLALVGNHDKDIFADEVTLKMFYEQCLGQPVDTLSEGYRRWVGKVYFGNEKQYLDGQGKNGSHQSVPWLPFYFCDRGFRLFLTHGQWRDIDNCRQIGGIKGGRGWKVKDGWRLDTWRSLNFAPFTHSCFGDSVAAGVLSGFIYRAKKALDQIETAFRTKGVMGPNETKIIKRLKRIFDELDLYRPTSLAVKRIIEESALLSREDPHTYQIRSMIETELLKSISDWLSWDFTFESASFNRSCLLRFSKVVVNILKIFGTKIQLNFLYGVMSLLTKLQRWQRDAPTFDEMLAFPAFLKRYRDYGFRIHGEGHTHDPLQEELYFELPESQQNYSYINFGTWRDQLVSKKKKGYRRRGVGRALIVLDLVEPSNNHSSEVGVVLKAQDAMGRRFVNWVEDLLCWGDRLDRF